MLPLQIAAKDTEILVNMTVKSGGQSGTRQIELNDGAHALLSLLGKQLFDYFAVTD